MRWIHLCGAACIASFLPSGAFATVIFDQTVDLTVVSGSISDFNSGNEGQQRAEDFRLNAGASTITDVNWWGVYATDTPGTDNFTIRIFADVSGAPEIDPLNEFAVGAVNRVDTGVDFVFAYSVDIAPLTLAANTTYWLSIVNDTTVVDIDDWGWATNDFGIFRGSSFRREDGQAWSDALGLELGFQLTNDRPSQLDESSYNLSDGAGHRSQHQHDSGARGQTLSAYVENLT